MSSGAGESGAGVRPIFGVEQQADQKMEGAPARRGNTPLPLRSFLGSGVTGDCLWVWKQGACLHEQAYISKRDELGQRGPGFGGTFVMGRIPNGFHEVKDAGVAPSSKPFFLPLALSGESFERMIAAGARC